MHFKEELFVIRHARSQHNVRDEEGLDAGITEWGERQAENVANFLKDQIDLEGFTFITSPFYRCLLSSLPIADKFGISFEVWPEFREYLNHSGKECVVRHRTDMPKFDWSRFAVDGQVQTETLYKEEYNEVFLNRIHDGYTLLPEKSVVVTHGLPAITLTTIAKGHLHMPVWDYSISNASITYIKRGRTIWHGRSLYHERDYDTKMYIRDYTVGTKKDQARSVG